MIRILKKHIGRPVDFTRADNGEIANGKVEDVHNRFATIRYWLPERYEPEGYVACLPVNDPRIVAVY
jgi:hypothetical protein